MPEPKLHDLTRALHNEYWMPNTDPARRREIMRQVKADPELLVAWDELRRGRHWH